MLKKFFLFGAVLVFVFTIGGKSFSVNAAPHDIGASDYGLFPKANYGVNCVGCGRDDCMTYIGMEQVGIGGTLYYLKYACSNCGSITYWTLHAR